MFRRRTKVEASATTVERFTYLHEGTVVRGSLEAVGRVRVHGTVLGDVRVEGVLEVAAGGVIEGARVEAAEVRVLGTVRAAVSAATRVEIWKDGVLEGDVTTAVLDIEEGATFVGRSAMPVAHAVRVPAGALEGGAPARARDGDASPSVPDGAIPAHDA